MIVFNIIFRSKLHSSNSITFNQRTMAKLHKILFCYFHSYLELGCVTCIHVQVFYCLMPVSTHKGLFPYSHFYSSLFPICGLQSIPIIKTYFEPVVVTFVVNEDSKYSYHITVKNYLTYETIFQNPKQYLLSKYRVFAVEKFTMVILFFIFHFTSITAKRRQLFTQHTVLVFIEGVLI